MTDELTTNLDPEIKRLVDEYNASNPPVVGVDSPQEIRRVAHASFTAQPPLTRDEGSERILEIPRTDDAGGPIEARLLRPPGPASSRPLLIWFHGGGWVLGSAHQATAICRTLMLHSHAAILNVDYRLAPEHPYPAAIEDCFETVRWVADNAASLGIDPDRIGVGAVRLGQILLPPAPSRRGTADCLNCACSAFSTRCLTLTLTLPATTPTRTGWSSNGMR